MLEIVGYFTTLGYLAGLVILASIVKFDEESYPWVAMIAIICWPIVAFLFLAIWLKTDGPPLEAEKPTDEDLE